MNCFSCIPEAILGLKPTRERESWQTDARRTPDATLCINTNMSALPNHQHRCAACPWISFAPKTAGLACRVPAERRQVNHIVEKRIIINFLNLGSTRAYSRCASGQSTEDIHNTFTIIYIQSHSACHTSEVSQEQPESWWRRLQHANSWRRRPNHIWGQKASLTPSGFYPVSDSPLHSGCTDHYERLHHTTMAEKSWHAKLKI